MRELGTYKRWREIVELNPGLDSSKLLVGKEIRLPGPAPAGTEAVAASVQPAREARGERKEPAAARTYAVRSGDSLWKIAARTLGDGERWKEIAALNPRTNPDRLVVGEELRLPDGARSATESAAPVVASSTPAAARKRGRVR
jgi:Tfp pilus assembly protein FimV